MSAIQIFCIIIVIFGASSLPIQFEDNVYSASTDALAANIQTNLLVEPKSELPVESIENDTAIVADAAEVANELPITITEDVDNKSKSNITMRNQIRPGMIVTSYSVEITPNVNGGTFDGRLVAQVSITDQATREDDIVFYVRDLNINSVQFSLVGGTFFYTADFSVDEDDGLLEIETGFEATLYTFVIEYQGSLSRAGVGLYAGHYDSLDYLAMNLYPTNARRVFPCIDEPTEPSSISFTFNNVNYNQLISNSLLEENSNNQFKALLGPPHLWSMAAHNLNNVNVPTNNVLLYIRPGVSAQDAQASIALNHYFNSLNEWTNKPYFEIDINQNSQLSILALPDVNVDWYGLSMIGVWEPYILMESSCSVRQRYLGLMKMAEALAKQWFGYVIYPENFRYEWVVSGLASYAAFEVVKSFQTDVTGNDVSLLDMNTLFVTEVIQESLLRDGYTSAHILDPNDDIFDEDQIRDNIHGILKYKAPALFRMMRLVLGDANQDFIQSAGRALVTGRALQTINTLNFVDAINSDWIQNGNGRVDDIDEYMDPWIHTNGCPLLHVGLRQGGVFVTQERFGFSTQSFVSWNVPITYTISTNPNYEEPMIYPVEMMEGTMSFNMFLDEEEGDYVLFNIQGQGYYRVNYDTLLWERIIEALEDPDLREQIHPLNRATLIDDSLNLARAGRIDYEIAFQVVLTMENEIEYAPWRAFIRNMNFLRKRLVALVEDDEDLDPDIYLRMVRRSIKRFEREIGFSPDPLITEPAMTSLTRGMVMDHACRSNYQPCIAAAVDWFYDPNTNENIVNPLIPPDLRPAVYCTMVREGGDDVINALQDRLAIEPSMYERVVILESLACSRDENYVRSYLEETVSANSPYTTEERVRIFIAAAESSYTNAWVALNFLTMRTNEVRDMYGGHAKLEEVIRALAENMGDRDQSNDFNVWVYAQNNNLDDSQFPAERVAAQVMENQAWENTHMEYVYEWIDENDAPTLIVSSILILASCIIALFNH